MPDLERAIQTLTGVTTELVRENRTLVQGLASDRSMFRETLRELSGFVATAGVALTRVEDQIGRLAGMMAENNRRIAENNEVIRRLLDILRRGRQNGGGPPV
jgi:hypothetical protein